MSNKMKNIGLIGLGMVAGVAASFQFSAFAQKELGAPLPLDELRQLADVYGLIKSDYVEPVEDKKLLSEAISGMVASLDPHSVYLDQRAFREMRESVAGKFVGLGIEVAMEDGYVRIVSPIEDSPAFRAGIKAGDLITRIDNTPVKGLSLDEAIKKMRGAPGSKVTLTIARRGDDKPWVVPVAREEIRVQSVKAKWSSRAMRGCGSASSRKRPSTSWRKRPARCTPRTRTSRAWYWTCAMTRVGCCRARSACRPRSCRRTR
jgi:carboxyl-terminal processing protease